MTVLIAEPAELVRPILISSRDGSNNGQIAWGRLSILPSPISSSSTVIGTAGRMVLRGSTALQGGQA